MPPVTSVEQLQPPEVKRALLSFRDALARDAGDNLVGLVLYGGLVRGRYQPGVSDVNIAIILKRTATSELARIAPALREGFRTARVEPWLLAEAELPRAADVFATKLRDLQRHRLLLHGQDPFAGLTAPREHLRYRAEQELRNLAMRLRRSFVYAANEPERLARTLSGALVPLAVPLEVVCELMGRPAPADADHPAVLAHAAATLDLDAKALGELAAVRAGQAPADAADLFGRVLRVVEAAAERADHLESAR